jgi:hypothetical protein
MTQFTFVAMCTQQRQAGLVQQPWQLCLVQHLALQLRAWAWAGGLRGDRGRGSGCCGGCIRGRRRVGAACCFPLLNQRRLERRVVLHLVPRRLKQRSAGVVNVLVQQHLVVQRSKLRRQVHVVLRHAGCEHTGRGDAKASGALWWRGGAVHGDARPGPGWAHDLGLCGGAGLGFREALPGAHADLGEGVDGCVPSRLPELPKQLNCPWASPDPQGPRCPAPAQPRRSLP